MLLKHIKRIPVGGINHTVHRTAEKTDVHMSVSYWRSLHRTRSSLPLEMVIRGRTMWGDFSLMWYVKKQSKGMNRISENKALGLTTELKWPGYGREQGVGRDRKDD